jgi:flagellar motor switch protein FliN/FliY
MTDEKDLDLSADVEDPEEQAETPEAAGNGAEAAGEEAAADSADVAVSDAASESDASESEGEGQVEAEAGEDFKVVNDADASEEDAEAAMLEMLEGLPQESDKAGLDDINFGSASVSKAEFQQLQEPVTGPETRNIDLLMDVDLPISIELGRTKMSISDILALGPGSVVELNKLAGEPVDLLVNYKVVAKGEVVVVDENFGLRITQLMTPEERLKALAEE